LIVKCKTAACDL